MGEPIPAALSIRAARLTPDLRQRLTSGGHGRRRLREALTFVKPAIKIDEQSGRAQDDYLRFDELARAGAILRADFTVDVERLGDQAQRALALLYGAATFVERLGADRRRGAGRVSFAVEGVDREEVVELLSVMPAPAFAAPVPAPLAPIDRGAASAQGRWQRVVVGFTLSAPTLSGATTAGNVVRSLDYLPGAYVLAAIARILDGAAVAAALRAGDLLVTPATLAIEDARGRPVPLCLHQHKDESGSLVNRLVSTADDSGPQTKQLRAGYIGIGPQPLLSKVRMSVSTHGTIDEESQRPTSEVGGVFSYSAIAAGQRLVAELRVRGERLGTSDEIAAALDGEPARLGRSKKDDYGAATIDAVALAGDENEGVADDATCTEATIWLLSDLFARDGALRPDPSLRGLLSALSVALGVTVTLVDGDGDGAGAMVRARRTDSWHAGWQLPRETIVAIQAGSCARLRFGSPVDRAALAELEISGLGARRGEGFGQVCFDDPLLTAAAPDARRPPQDAGDDGDRSEPDEPPAELLGAEHPAASFGRRIEEAAWRAEITRLAALAAAGDEKRYNALGLDPLAPGKPRTAQLSALRNAALRLDDEPEDEPDALRSWLAGVFARPARRDLWPSGSLATAGANPGATDGAVRRLCTERGYVWTVLGDEAHLLDAGSPMCLTRAGAQLRKDLETWALQALIDACVHAIVRDREHAPRVGVGDGS